MDAVAGGGADADARAGVDRGRGTRRLRRDDRRADRRRPAVAYRSWQDADRDGGGRAGGDVAGAVDPELGGAGVRGFGTGAARAFGAHGPGHTVHAAGAAGVLVLEPRGAGFRAAVGILVVLVVFFELVFAVGFSVAFRVAFCVAFCVAVCVPLTVGLVFTVTFDVAVIFAFHIAFHIAFDVAVVFAFDIAFDIAVHVDVCFAVHVDVCFGFRGRGVEFGLIRN